MDLGVVLDRTQQRIECILSSALRDGGQRSLGSCGVLAMNSLAQKFTTWAVR